MSIICRLFGHAPLTKSGWARGVGYARISGSTIDGMGVSHLFLSAECPRCGIKYNICNVQFEAHLKSTQSVEYLVSSATRRRHEC